MSPTDITGICRYSAFLQNRIKMQRKMERKCTGSEKRP